MTLFKICVPLFLVISGFTQANAQQLPIFTQYRDYYGLINPAAVTSDFFAESSSEVIYNFGISHRQQWIGPISTIYTSVARADFFFNNDNRGLSFLGGGYIINDRAGSTTNNGLYLRGALFLGDPGGSFWGLGFNIGGISLTIEKNNLDANDPDDPLIYANFSETVLDLGVGLFGVIDINGENKIYGGISSPQLLSSKPQSQDSIKSSIYNRLTHIYTYGGMIINTSHNRNQDDFSFLEFSVWGKYFPNVPYHLDFNVRYQISNPLWLGIGFSTSDILHLETGVNIYPDFGRIKIGYGYDLPYNKLYTKQLGGSHEINLSLLLGK